jgi:hypothetical protein
MEERRQENKEFFGKIEKFIEESRVYRAQDEITQKFQVENIEALKNAVIIQNGRVVKLEKWQQEIEQKIKQRKDNYATIQAWITVIATVVMAISAYIMIFKK